MPSLVWRVLGLVLMLGALSLPLARAPDKPVEAFVARWALPPSELVEFDGQLLHLRDEGPRSDTQPILLLHGAGSSLHDWDAWAKELARERRVLRLDLPGFGLTGPWNDLVAASGAGYDAATLARFVGRWLEHRGVRRVTVVGHSMGGAVAVRLAQQAPEQVGRLLLLAPGGLEQPATALTPLLRTAAQWPPVRLALTELLPRGVVARELADHFGDPSKLTSERIDRQMDMLQRDGNRLALARWARGRLDEGAWPPKLELSQPVMLLWGGRDRILVPALAERWRTAIPGSAVVVLPTLGHALPEEDPAATLSVARAFLRGSD